MDFNEIILDDLTWATRFAWVCALQQPPHVDRQDLQSAGVMGYLQAASRFKIEKGASFRGYCSVRIRGAILDELRRWDWAPRSVHEEQKRITRITDELSESLSRAPLPSEIATALGLTEDALRELQGHAKPHQLVSFDETPSHPCGEESLPLCERLPDPHAAPPFATLLRQEMRADLQRAMAQLLVAEARVLTLHYLEGLTFRQICRIMQVSPSRISQMHHAGLQRLRRLLPPELGVC